MKPRAAVCGSSAATMADTTARPSAPAASAGERSRASGRRWRRSAFSSGRRMSRSPATPSGGVASRLGLLRIDRPDAEIIRRLGVGAHHLHRVGDRQPDESFRAPAAAAPRRPACRSGRRERPSASTASAMSRRSLTTSRTPSGASAAFKARATSTNARVVAAFSRNCTIVAPPRAAASAMSITLRPRARPRSVTRQRRRLASVNRHSARFHPPHDLLGRAASSASMKATRKPPGRGGLLGGHLADDAVDPDRRRGRDERSGVTAANAGDDAPTARSRAR